MLRENFKEGTSPAWSYSTGYCPVMHTNSNSRKQVNNEEPRLRKYCHLNNPALRTSQKK